MIRKHIPGAEARFVADRNVRAEALTYLEAKTSIRQTLGCFDVLRLEAEAYEAGGELLEVGDAG